MNQALKRNPTIPLIALSWGMPYWVGNGTYLSAGGVKYHVDWLLGAKLHHNLTFTLVGVWNEAPWTKEYIVLLRKGLDDAGLHHVGIIAADGLPDIIADAAADAELAAAIAAFGVHSHVLPAAPDARKMGIPYYNSENDLVDGVLPQWGGANKPGTNWPLVFMLNYIEANGTATMLCPFIHSWSMNLGRHNHGQSNPTQQRIKYVKRIKQTPQHPHFLLSERSADCALRICQS